MNKIRRIGFLGGPGIGKSTCATRLFSELKTLQYNIEYVSEYVKKWAIDKKPIKEYDQIYFLGKQQHYEYQNLINGIEYIITDSPMLLTYIYSKIYYPNNKRLHKGIKELILDYELQYPSLNVFLNRNNKFYNSLGRYQTKQQAKNIDQLIKEECEIFSNEIKRPYINAYFDFNDYDGILNYLNKELKNNKNKL